MKLKLLIRVKAVRYFTKNNADDDDNNNNNNNSNSVPSNTRNLGRFSDTLRKKKYQKFII
ncbi:hypothetical protein E2C01_022464 [Portunus trituberculatus]|uniref:Uncharacterized protein n=1 Tax=Portunus trituberculatus TaxID=210409 RepID=A0A5B7E5H5_PORTR|nr:hypothetical protein [Portunus trituberculatus]